MQNVIDEIKSKIDIVDLLSEYIQLRPAGVNFKALCPFHHEKTPSFLVSPERQIWHCFGCGLGGSIFDFLMQIEGLEFPEALRVLAKRAGVEIERGDYHVMSQKTKLLDVLRMAAKFYHLILLDSTLAVKARQYLEERGIKKETIDEFQLGFAPERWDELWKFLGKKGYKEKDIELAGLIIKSTTPGRGGYYDRFRNRIMFPINDLYSNPVGFTSRIVPWAERKDEAKYINTPETPVYNKSRILYGLDKAKLEIKRKNAVILVEGNMDVIACHQAGSLNVVASSGTALTLEQVKLLKRYTNNLLLAFDVDLAGETATQRGIDVALKEEMNVKVIQVPEGKDPDECIKENPQKWFKAVEDAKSVMSYYFDLVFQKNDLTSVEGKKNITKILLPVLAKLGDSVEQDYWLKFLTAKLGVAEYSLRDKIKKIKNTKQTNVSDELQNERPNKEKMAGEILLGFLFKRPDLTINYFIDLPTEVFVTVELQALVQIVKDCYNINQPLEIETLRKNIKTPELVAYFDYLGLLIENEFFNDLTVKNKSGRLKIDVNKHLGPEIQKIYKFLKKGHLTKKRSDLTSALKEAEKQKDKNKIDDFLSQLASINKQIHEV